MFCIFQYLIKYVKKFQNTFKLWFLESVTYMRLLRNYYKRNNERTFTSIKEKCLFGEISYGNTILVKVCVKM